jgi:hypothetical protein
MNGPDHYREAERTLALARCATAQQAHNTEPDEAVTMMLAAAQVHATLALAAATALSDPEGGMPIRDWNAWQAATGTPKGGAS